MRARIVFRVKGWINREEFKELLSVADYMGRDSSGSIFEVNWLKAREKGLKPQDLLSFIEDRGGVFDERSMPYVRRLREKSEKVVLEWMGVDVIMRPYTYLGDRLSDLRGMVSYNKASRVFLVKPMMFFELKHRLGLMGLEVEDKTGLQESLPLSIRLEFTGSLRDYQEEAVKALEKQDWRGVIALPTGSGKTVVAIAAMTKLKERTLIVTYTKEQMFQWADMIQKFTNLRREHIGLYYGERKRIAPIMITTYQTAYRHIKKLAPLFSLLIIDEVHHLPADKFRHIAVNSFAPKRIGLSATVVREDGRHVELFSLLGVLVYHKSPSELAEKGYLAPYIIRQIYVKLNGKEREEYTSLRQAYRSFAGGRTFEEVVRDAKHGDRRALLALKAHSRMRLLVNMAEEKLRKTQEIVRRELELGSKIIIFTQYVEQAEKLGEILGAPVLTGQLDTPTRRRILQGFKNNEFRVLVVTTVGDEGIDIPDANVGIIVAGTGSRRQFFQRLGRILRPGVNKQAKLYEIIVKETVEESQARRRKNLSLEF